MFFIIRLTDHEDKMHIREKYLEAHKEYLRNTPAVIEAGSIHPGPKEKPLGGIWVVQCADQETVWEVLKQDPFYAKGLRKNVEILNWQIINKSLN